MELVLFIGLPGAGKSTFFQARFRETHLRLSLDMLRTRHREAILFEACLRSKTRCVIDNTNPSRADRMRYIPLAKAAGFRVTGFYFRESLIACLERNRLRVGMQCIPDAGVRHAAARLEPPTFAEGFDELQVVTVQGKEFLVRPDETFHGETADEVR